MGSHTDPFWCRHPCPGTEKMGSWGRSQSPPSCRISAISAKSNQKHPPPTISIFLFLVVLLFWYLNTGNSQNKTKPKLPKEEIKRSSSLPLPPPFRSPTHSYSKPSFNTNPLPAMALSVFPVTMKLTESHCPHELDFHHCLPTETALEEGT